VITVIGRWLQMRFGTRVLLVVGLLAVLDRLTPRPPRRAGVAGGRRRVTHRLALTAAELPGS
jgi:hypothetical protein